MQVSLIRLAALGTMLSMAALPPVAQCQTQPTFFSTGRLSVKTNPLRPEQHPVFHFTGHLGSGTGQRTDKDFTLLQCGTVSPEAFARRVGRIVVIAGVFAGSAGPADSLCATRLNFSPADGELTQLPEITSATAISGDRSAIIGDASSPSLTGHSYKYSNGQYSDIGHLGGGGTHAAALSNDG